MPPINVNALIAGALNFGVDQAEAHKPEILAWAKSEDINVEKAADAFVDSLPLKGVLAAFKGMIRSALDGYLSAQLPAVEDQVFELIVAAARNEAAKLAAG